MVVYRCYVHTTVGGHSVDNLGYFWLLYPGLSGGNDAEAIGKALKQKIIDNKGYMHQTQVLRSISVKQEDAMAGGWEWEETDIDEAGTDTQDLLPPHITGVVEWICYGNDTSRVGRRWWLGPIRKIDVTCAANGSSTGWVGVSGLGSAPYRAMSVQLVTVPYNIAIPVCHDPFSDTWATAWTATVQSRLGHRRPRFK